MTWETLRPAVPAKRAPMSLRVFRGDILAGNLSRGALEHLFGDDRQGRVEFQQDSTTGQLSMIAVRLDGYRVGKIGRVRLAAIREAIGDGNFTVMLTPDEDDHRERRLVFGEVRRR